MTALHRACRACKPYVVDGLLKARANGQRIMCRCRALHASHQNVVRARQANQLKYLCPACLPAARARAVAAAATDDAKTAAAEGLSVLAVTFKVA